MSIDPTIPPWPMLLAPRDITDPQLIMASMSGPQPLAGAPQAVMSGAGRWSIQLIGIPVYNQRAVDPDRFAIWRTIFTGRLQQGLAVYMPFWDWARGPVARANLLINGPTSTYSDTSTFSDGSVFGQSNNDCALAAAASDGATALSVDVANVRGTPIAGDFVSIAGRAYLIVGASPDGTVANRWNWQIMPTLRGDQAALTDIEIRNPVCQMVLNLKDRNNSLTREYGLLGRGTLTFVEDNWK